MGAVVFWQRLNFDKPDVWIEQVDTTARPTLHAVSKIGIKMREFSAATPKIHAEIRAFPLCPPVRRDIVTTPAGRQEVVRLLVGW